MRKFFSGLWDLPDRRAPWWGHGLTMAVLLVLLSLLCWAILSSTARRWDIFWNYRQAFWQGWLLTIGLSACSLLVSTLVGIATALARRCSFLPLRHLATLYVELVRGMPFLVLILILYYGIPQVTRFANQFIFGVLALSLFAGAYISEMVRAGIEAIGSSQRESARAIGLTTFQTYRFVILPQAIRQILPPLTGQFASLIKDSSLLSVIGLAEFTYSAQQVFSATYSGVESFLPLGLGYLVLTLLISLLSRQLEAKFRYET